jgi:hypothetical protein
LEKPVDASNHFVMFQQCAATGGSSTFLDGGGEARFVLEQAVNSFLNHLRDGFAGTGGVLQETGFFLRIEMEFHRLESKVCLAWCQCLRAQDLGAIWESGDSNPKPSIDQFSPEARELARPDVSPSLLQRYAGPVQFPFRDSHFGIPSRLQVHYSARFVTLDV